MSKSRRDMSRSKAHKMDSVRKARRSKDKVRDLWTKEEDGHVQSE